MKLKEPCRVCSNNFRSVYHIDSKCPKEGSFIHEILYFESSDIDVLEDPMNWIAEMLTKIRSRS